MPSPPFIGRLLLRLVPLGERRPETESDLLELFEQRVGVHGYRSAARRYTRDVVSLLWRRRASTGPQPARVRRWTFAAAHGRPLEGIAGDLRYAARMFARQPITIGVTVLGLGLAIGLSGSVFTLMNAALLRSDGVRDSARAPRVLRTIPNGISTAWGYDEYRQLREAARLSRVEAWVDDAASFSVSSTPVEDAPVIPVAFVSGGYMEALQARTVAGRVLTEADAAGSAAPVVVVSHAFWQRHLDADLSIVGRPLRIGRMTATVVGIAERPFAAPFTNGTGLWVPMSAYHLVYDSQPIGARASHPVAVVARVAAKGSIAAAEAELTAIAGTLENSRDPSTRAGAQFDVNSRLGRGPASQQFAVALAVSVVLALVLMLACVNVASVLLANAIMRSREIGVRLALGATRRRIVRQLLTESSILAVASSSTGLLLTIWLAPLIARLIKAPPTLELGLDLNVYLFFIAVAGVCGVGAGLVPSRVGTRGDIVSPLKGSGFAASSAAPQRLRSALLGVQAAASILLLVLATLFARATVRATRVDVGLDADRLVTLRVGFGRPSDEARVKAYWATALEEVGALPGVERAALIEFPPFGGASRVMSEQRDGKRRVIYFNRTSASYFDTVGLRVLRGRTFTDEEVASDARVAVISETVAQRYWQGRDPLGKTLESITEHGEVVIGVVSDAIVARLHEGTHGAVYAPLPPSALRMGSLIVRTDGNLAMVVPLLREALRSLGPSLTIRTALVKDGLEEEVSRPRILALISGSMAVLAVLLAAIGLYGVTGAVIGQRTREIGLRIALGAERGDVTRLLLRESLRPVMIGLIAGVLFALLGSRAISGALFGVPPHDPMAFGVAIAILLASTVTAVLVPTRKAAKVDPAFVLRQG
jgi:predicted permease